MNSQSIPHSQKDQQNYPLIVYQPEGSVLEIKLSADPERRTIWATQKQIAEALDLSISVVSRHITKFKEQRGNEAYKGIAKFAIPTNGGVQSVEHYDMTVVTYVGFRAQVTERVIAFQDWVGRELDRILSEKHLTLTPAELILAQAKQLVEHERGIRDLEQRQDNHEDRLSRVEARQTAMIDSGSQYMSISAYCLWKNIDSEIYNPQHLPMLIDKAAMLSKDKRYTVGKAQTPHGYEDTFHLNILNEIFAGFR